jgi:hypothetical protein
MPASTLQQPLAGDPSRRGFPAMKSCSRSTSSPIISTLSGRGGVRSNAALTVSSAPLGFYMRLSDLPKMSPIRRAPSPEVKRA